MKTSTDPSLAEWNEIVVAFHKESARGAAIIAAAYMEEYLKYFLRKSMLKDKNIDKLFDAMGPLATFSASIEIAYAFGRIPQDIYNDLHTIRKIRNHFAHHPNKASFGDRKIHDWCKNLTAYATIKGYRKRNSPRFSYLATVTRTIGSMHNAILTAEQKRDHSQSRGE